MMRRFRTSRHRHHHAPALLAAQIDESREVLLVWVLAELRHPRLQPPQLLVDFVLGAG